MIVLFGAFWWMTGAPRGLRRSGPQTAAPPPPPVTQPATQPANSMYTVLGGQAGNSMAILIDSKLCNVTDLQRVCDELKRETAKGGYARVLVFGDPFTHSERPHPLEGERVDSGDSLVADYMRNDATGVHVLRVMLNGPKGPVQEFKQ